MQPKSRTLNNKQPWNEIRKTDTELNAEGYSYLMRIDGFAQLRDTVFDAKGASNDLNQLQLKRSTRIIRSRLQS